VSLTGGTAAPTFGRGAARRTQVCKGDTMGKFSSRVVLGCVVALSLSVVGCGQINNLRAKMAFREGNSAYQAGEWQEAATAYEEVLSYNPSEPQMLTSYFFLGNSLDNQYRPGRVGDAANDAILARAIENYKMAIDLLDGINPQFRTLSMQYLIAAYGSDKLNDPSLAEPLLRQMLQEDANNPPTYFILSRLYEDAGDYEQAEAALVAARNAVPGDASIYTTMAAYYDRQDEFDKLVEALEARTAQEPNNPEAYYTIATYYFNKASRDFTLSDSDKATYAESGVDAVDRALALNENYIEAIVFKGLLLRLQANVDPSVARQRVLLDEADALGERAEELRLSAAAGIAAS
jgi:tetratricopeptide (TPR) repeat protein